MAKRRHPD